MMLRENVFLFSCETTIDQQCNSALQLNKEYERARWHTKQIVDMMTHEFLENEHKKYFHFIFF